MDATSTGTGSRLLPTLAAVAALGYAAPASAITLVGPDPAISIAEREFCRAPLAGGGFAKFMACVSRAYYEIDPLAANNANFKLAFDTWNAAQPAGSKWTLETKPEPDWILEIDIFKAFAKMYVGGMEIRIKIDTNDDTRPYFWSQGLSLNYIIGPLEPTVPNYRTMDTATLSGLDCTRPTIFCDPLYPYQYRDRRFYDGPQGPWPNSKFDALAMLSQADYTLRKLTVFGGVGWGFELSAKPYRPIPEPGGWAMLLLGFGLACGMMSARRSAMTSTR